MVIDVEDRTLAHLQVVIAAKLRRGESMMFSWRDPSETGDGRTSVWLHPVADLTFKYYGGRRPAINQAWVERLVLQANSPAGLQMIEEPSDHQTAPHAPAAQVPMASSAQR